MRVNTETLDRFLGTVGEVILSSSQLRTAATGKQPAAPGRAGAAGVSVGLDRMDRVVGELQRRALELRTTPLLRIVEPLPRMAREIAQRLGKRVEVEIGHAELEVDRSILDRLSDPLVHLVRNSVDHGVESPEVRRSRKKDETGHIAIEARREKDSVLITISDDGGGIDLDAVRDKAIEAGAVLPDLAEDLPPDQIASFVFQPGITTADAVSDISGRGVGMDAVRATIESLGGQVEIETRAGHGTSVTLIVPVSAAVQRVLLLGVAGETVAIPVARIERILEVPAETIQRSGSEAFALIDDEPTPVLLLAELLSLPSDETDGTQVIAMADVRGESVALAVDSIVGHQQIYVKPVPELLAGIRVLAGFTILGDGHPVFLLDPNQLA